MANPIPERLKTGTFGELLVQLRLLQYEVQAAPPLKNSGNDLIAVKGDCFKAIQVKTTTNKIFQKPSNDKIYHILAVVNLVGDGSEISLDNSHVFLIKKENVSSISNNIDNLENYRMTQELVNELFQ